MVMSNAAEHVMESWKIKTEYIICIRVFKCVLKVVYFDQDDKTSKQDTLNKNLGGINTTILGTCFKTPVVFYSDMILTFGFCIFETVKHSMFCCLAKTWGFFGGFFWVFFLFVFFLRYDTNFLWLILPNCSFFAEL